VVDINIDLKARRIEATLIGDVVPQSTLSEVANHLQSDGLAGTELKVFQTGDQRMDVATLKSSLLGDLYKRIQLALVALENKDKTIEQLRGELDSQKANEQRFKDIPAELHALYPHIEDVLLSESPDWNAGTGWNSRNTVVLSIRSSKRLSKGDQARIEQWLRKRLKSDSVKLVVEKGRA
jgi:hypothetical protein